MMSSFAAKPKEFTIRLADYRNRQDGQSILGLLDHYAQHPMGGGNSLSAYVLDNLIPSLQKHNGAFSVLAFIDGQPVGLVNCFQSFSTFQCRPIVNIHDVIVRESHRGQGLADKMLARVQSHAKELGSCKLTLEVLEGNEIAKKVYHRFGFNAYSLDPVQGNAMFWEKTI